MKQLMIAVVLVGALTGAAADASYTWDATNKTLSPDDGGVTVACDGDTANVLTLTANPTDGGTVTISGAMTFADGATITLATSGTVSFAEKVTTKGATTLARGDNAYIVWKGSSALTDADAGVLVAEGLTRAEVDFVSLVVGVDSAPAYGPYFYVSGPDENGFYVFNRVTSKYVYSTRAQLMDKADGLHIRCRTGLRSPSFGLYPDEEDGWATENLWDKWTGKATPAERGWYGRTDDAHHKNYSDYLGAPSKLGFNKAIFRRKGLTGEAKVCFAGGASFGGTTTIDAGIEAVLTASPSITASATGALELRTAFAGDGDFTAVAPPAPANSETLLGHLTLDWQVLARNRRLADVKAITGYMQGSSHNPMPNGVPQWCPAYFLDYDQATDTGTCQFHCKNGSKTYKYVCAELKQDGDDILIKALGQGYVSSNGTPGDQKRTPTTLRVAIWNEDTHSYPSTGYGILNVTAFFDETDEKAAQGFLRIAPNADFSGLVGGKMTFGGDLRSALPIYAEVTNKLGLASCGEIHVCTNAALKLNATGCAQSTGISGGHSKIVVHAGGILRNPQTWQIANNQEVLLDGGRFACGSTTLYNNWMTLSNAVLSAIAPRFSDSLLTTPYPGWRVIGDSPSRVLCANGINIYGKKSEALARSANMAFRAVVNDVTGDGDSDFIVTRLRGACDRTSDREDFTWFWFEKYGKGTMELTGDSREVRLESRLYGGTLLLGASGIMTNAVQLLGGSLAVADGAQNELGDLSATTNGTLTVGAGGMLSFKSFTPDAGLQPKSITIDAPLAGNVLKFGTTLTSAQRAMFRWKDGDELRHVRQDENGYLHPFSGTVFYVK